MKKLLLSLMFCLFFSPAFAGGYSKWAVPTIVEIVSGGVLIRGAFGDPNNCTLADYIFIRSTDARYDSILSMSYTALVGKREMRFYSSTCTSVGFHWGLREIINENKGGQAVFIR